RLCAGWQRIKARQKQFEQLARDLRMMGQRLADVGQAEGEAGLPQVLAVSPQNHHLAPGEARAQHQLVEIVVLRRAAPDLGEGVLEQALDLVERQAQARV